jgi:hypothetical protein
MNEEFLKIVEETFNEEISSSCAETVLGLESWIDGKDNFITSLRKKNKRS